MCAIELFSSRHPLHCSWYGITSVARLVRVSVFRESNNYDHYLLTVNLPAGASLVQYSAVQCMLVAVL